MVRTWRHFSVIPSFYLCLRNKCFACYVSNDDWWCITRTIETNNYFINIFFFTDIFSLPIFFSSSVKNHSCHNSSSFSVHIYVFEIMWEKIIFHRKSSLPYSVLFLSPEMFPKIWHFFFHHQCNVKTYWINDMQYFFIHRCSHIASIGYFLSIELDTD